jgi:hypothetical protein
MSDHPTELSEIIRSRFEHCRRYEPALFAHALGREPDRVPPNGKGFDQDAPKSLKPTMQV